MLGSAYVFPEGGEVGGVEELECHVGAGQGLGTGDAGWGGVGYEGGEVEWVGWVGWHGEGLNLKGGLWIQVKSLECAD